MKAKKLHIDECYVCIISFIRSVLALTSALMPWSWPWDMRPWAWPWWCWSCEHYCWRVGNLAFDDFVSNLVCQRVGMTMSCPGTTLSVTLVLSTTLALTLCIKYLIIILLTVILILTLLKCTVQLYHSLLRPKLEYCIQAWNPHVLEKIQKWATCLMINDGHLSDWKFYVLLHWQHGDSVEIWIVQNFQTLKYTDFCCIQHATQRSWV